MEIPVGNLTVGASYNIAMPGRAAKTFKYLGEQGGMLILSDGSFGPGKETDRIGKTAPGLVIYPKARGGARSRKQRKQRRKSSRRTKRSTRY